MRTIVDELRGAARRLRASPVFAVGAALLLSLGLGATTTFYGVVETVLLDPLPFPESHRLVRLRMVRPGASGSTWSEAEHVAVEARTRALDVMAAWDDERSVNLVLADGAVRLNAAAATANFTDAVGLGPAIGRFFSAEEDRPGGPAVVVLSNRFWRQAFAEDPAVLGRPLAIGGVPAVVIGVLPLAYETLFPAVEIWMPLRLDRAVPNVNSGQFLDALGRLNPGATAASLRAELDRVAPQLTDEGLTRYPGSTVAAMPLRDDLVSGVRTELTAIFALLWIVLLTICFNVAGLLLARGTRLRRELALRACLGASRGRLAAAGLAEAALVAAAGLVGGLAVAALGVAAAARLGSPVVPRAVELGIDPSALLAGAGLGAAPLMALAVAPALTLLRGLRAETLSRERSPAGGSAAPGRKAIVVVQLAVSAALLAGAIVLARSVMALGRVDLGYEVEQVTSFRVDLPPDVYRTAADANRLLNALIDEVASIPGIHAAGATSLVPMDGRLATGFAWTSAATVDGALPTELQMRWITPGYFETLGVPLVEGRTFHRADATGSAQVTVLSRSLAEALWPGKSAVGRTWKLGRLVNQGTPWRTVIGVVDDIRIEGPRGAVRPVAYFPHNHLGVGREIQVVAAGSVPEAALFPEVRRRVATLDVALPVHGMQAMTRLRDRALALNRLGTQLVGGFAMLAALLAAIGVYGLIGYSATERAPELAIRSALGASRRGLVGLIVRDGLALALLAVVPGLAGGVGVAWLLGSLVVGVSPFDPASLGIAGCGVVAIGVLAALAPAARAASADPAVVLRGW